VATGPERRRFTRWLGPVKPGKKRFTFQLEFEIASGEDPNDLVLALELANAVTNAAIETHDVGAIRLRSYTANGRKLT